MNLNHRSAIIVSMICLTFLGYIIKDEHQAAKWKTSATRISELESALQQKQEEADSLRAEVSTLSVQLEKPKHPDIENSNSAEVEKPKDQAIPSPRVHASRSAISAPLPRGEIQKQKVDDGRSKKKQWTVSEIKYACLGRGRNTIKTLLGSPDRALGERFWSYNNMAIMDPRSREVLTSLTLRFSDDSSRTVHDVIVE